MDIAVDMTGAGLITWWKGDRAGSDRLGSAAELPMPGAYFELAMREFGGSAEAEAALRAGTGTTSDEPGGEITLRQQLQQVHNINRLQAPGWGVRLACVAALYFASSIGTCWTILAAQSSAPCSPCRNCESCQL